MMMMMTTTMMIIITIIWTDQYVFGYAGGERIECPQAQIFFFFDTASELSQRLRNFATHKWSVKLIQFRLAWKPRNEYSYTSNASKRDVVTAPSEVSGAEAS